MVDDPAGRSGVRYCCPAGIAQGGGEFLRGFLHVVRQDRHRYRLRRVPGMEGQRTGCRRVVRSGHRGPVRACVVHRDVLPSGGIQGHCEVQGTVTGALGQRRAGYAELRKVIVLDRTGCRAARRSQRCMDSDAQPYHERLGVFRLGVVQHRYRDRLRRGPGFERQCTPCRPVVRSGVRGPVGGRVVHRHLSPAGLIQPHDKAQGAFWCTLGRGISIGDRQPGRSVVVLDDPGDRGRRAASGQHSVRGVAQRDGEVLVGLVQRVVNHRDLDRLCRGR